jgi:uncharacterized membrane protein YjfL (UPF0719 family)
MKSDISCLLICLKLNTLLNLFHSMPAMLYSEAFTSLFLLHFDKKSCFYVQDKYKNVVQMNGELKNEVLSFKVDFQASASVIAFLIWNIASVLCLVLCYFAMSQTRDTTTCSLPIVLLF